MAPPGSSNGFGGGGGSSRPPRVDGTPARAATTSGFMTAGATATIPLTAIRASEGWSLLPIAPTVVAIVGLAVALVIGIVGVQHLQTLAEAHAAERVALLADAVGARLEPLGDPARLEVMKLAARRTGSELVLVDGGGRVVLDASLGTLSADVYKSLIAQGHGETTARLGQAEFAVRAVGPPRGRLYLAVFASAPKAPEGAPALVTALVALTTLLVGVAAMVAYFVGRDAISDVVFVTDRVHAMATVRSEPTGEPVPVRTLDEIGTLTSEINALMGRFAAAERTYRANLERARGADRDRAGFLAAVSHELRSPLNAILGFADILATEVDGPLTDTAREEVGQIRESGSHLLELINDILELSAIEGGQLKLSRARTDLTQIASEVVKEAAGIVGTKPLHVYVTGEANVPTHADARRVRQIVQNLVGNAIKFTQRGEVVVQVVREGPKAVLRVSDTGPGIDAAERAAIFDEYKQAGERSARHRGTGLGLAIARRLVLMHGGLINVESELGKGSTFTVALPLWFEREEPRA